VDRERWQRVQEQLTRNTAFSPRNAKHNYLLKGLIQCGGCGARVIGDPCHGKFYYRCHKRCKRLPTVREETFNDAVWQAIAEAIRDPSLIVEQVNKLYTRRAQSSRQTQSELAEVDAALQQVEGEESRLVEAYRHGLLPMVLFGKEMEQIKARKSALEERKSNLNRQGEVPPLAEIKRSVAEYCKIATQQMKKFSDEMRQRFLRLLVTEIIYEGVRIRIRGVLRIVNSASRKHVEADSSYGDKNFFDRRIASIMMHSYNRNADFSLGGIATMTSYRDARNSVIEAEEIPFEISQVLPQKITIHEQIDLDWVRDQVRANPLVTLKGLSDLIHQQFGVTPSLTHMERILRLASISRIPGSRAKQVAA
jgi:hypothetical protein